jgi:4-hydroxymandelate synthase
MKIQGIDHIEFYVADLSRWAADLTGAYGFCLSGRAERADHESLLFRSGRAQLLVTAARGESHPAAGYVHKHGDGAAVIGLRTDDVRAAFAEAVAGGADPLADPVFVGASDGRVGTAAVTGFGDVTHKLIERAGPVDDFAPGLVTMTSGAQAAPDGTLAAIDHIAVCVLPGQLNPTVHLYQRAFGLCEIFDERIEVGGQAMISKVVQDSTREVTYTLIEPDLTREPGQIDDFLAAHEGAGVQHVALRTGDIAGAVRTLSGRGVEFLTTPPSYYDLLDGRLGQLSVPTSQLRPLNVLADRDRYGEMYQIFAKSTHERRTFFFELIERRGALTFGSRNIKALYEALDLRRATTAHPPPR